MGGALQLEAPAIELGELLELAPIWTTWCFLGASTCASAEIGAELLGLQQQLCDAWHQWKGGTMDWPQLQQGCRPIRHSFETTLQRVVNLGFERGEQTLWAKTVGTCRQQ